MEPKQMLEAVIEKAKENGFTFEQIWSGLPENATMEIYDGDEDLVFMSATMSPIGGWRMNFPTLLFNHSFARGFFKGEHAYCDACHRHHPSFSDCDAGVGNNQEAWEHHLTQAVLSEDPLLYYYERLA